MVALLTCILSLSLPRVSHAIVVGDLNGDGIVSISEVQAVINSYLGINTGQSRFTPNDLTGTWYFFQLNSGAYNYNWTATYIVDASGHGQTTNGTSSSGNTGQIRSFSGSIDANGIVSTAGSSDKMVMSQDKSLLMSVNSSSDGYSMTVAIKAGSGFAQSDLTGSWTFHALTVSSSKQVWAHSDASFDSNGVMTLSNYLSNSGNTTPGNSNSSVSIDGTGLLAGGKGAMSRDKNLIAMVVTNTDGSVSLGFLARKGGVFTQSDVKGTWNTGQLKLNGTTNSWQTSLTVFDSAGLGGYFDEVSNGIAQPDRQFTSAVALSSSGVLTTPVPGTVSDFDGIMMNNKSLVIYTTSGSPGYSIMGFFLK